LLCAWACSPDANPVRPVSSSTSPTPDIPIANGFAYPVGKSETVTEAKDKDEWYVALEFGENDHLGEDWNMNTGGNSDCGQPAYAAADGFITFAHDAGSGWGNVVIIEHHLQDGEHVETLYGHLLEITKTEGMVRKREVIGKVGNANGRYLCHLHFELRLRRCPMWDQAGPGYALDRDGWTDPSDFIDAHR
jgi:murein DD-endopeptidase MepM/ murein hydrolase activator NlpD